MKTHKLTGVILVVIGIIALAYQGIIYKPREKVVDVGAIQMTAGHTETPPMSPLGGAVVLMSGIVLLVM